MCLVLLWISLGVLHFSEGKLERNESGGEGRYGVRTGKSGGRGGCGWNIMCERRMDKNLC